MITKKLFQFILIAIVALFIQVPTQAATCNKSYTLGFFNGVWNTFGEASEGASKLKDIIGPTYNNEPVKYESFYNHTAPGYDVLGLQDVAETFIQRANEIDKSGQMGKRFEYFWEFLGSSEPTFLDKLAGFLPNAASLFDSVYTAMTTKLTSIISFFLSNPPTEADYAAHNARLDVLAADGQKLMLVGHSQGNLFMNHAYDHILPVVTKDRVAAAHIAPASPTLRGDWILANIDLVINALRIQGVNSVPDINLTIPVSKVDASGHTLIGTYLDGTRDGRGKVKTMIEAGMGKLHCPYSTVTFSSHIYYEPAFPYVTSSLLRGVMFIPPLLFMGIYSNNNMPLVEFYQTREHYLQLIDKEIIVFDILAAQLNSFGSSQKVVVSQTYDVLLNRFTISLTIPIDPLFKNTKDPSSLICVYR